MRKADESRGRPICFSSYQGRFLHHRSEIAARFWLDPSCSSYATGANHVDFGFEIQDFGEGSNGEAQSPNPRRSSKIRNLKSKIQRGVTLTCSTKKISGG